MLTNIVPRHHYLRQYVTVVLLGTDAQLSSYYQMIVVDPIINISIGH